MPNNQKGFGLIEVLISLALVALVVVSLGRLLSLIYQLYGTSELKTKGLSYAQQSLEIVTAIKNEQFACRCDADVCGGGNCVRLADVQSCKLQPGYTSCWTPYPKNVTVETVQLVNSGSGWSLVALAPGVDEVVSTKPNFWRRITITNVRRNAAGDIDPSGMVDPQTKKITVTVRWDDRSRTGTVELSTIITAWQNL